MILPRDLPARLAHDGYVGLGDECDAPGPTMTVLSASKAEQYTPGIDDVCISIHGRREDPTALQRGGRRRAPRETHGNWSHAGTRASCRRV